LNNLENIDGGLLGGKGAIFVINLKKYTTYEYEGS
jgi:hypothetical protein